MTTFTTRNQAQRKYFYIAGLLIALIAVLVLIFRTFDDDTKCDSNEVHSTKSTSSQISAEEKAEEKTVEYVTIDTNLGKIRGIKNLINDVTVNTFYGVPYAQPPTRSLRFKKSEPLEAWDDVKDALQQPASCLQVMFK